jgi:AmmeMemoRadiSam system protein B
MKYTLLSIKTIKKGGIDCMDVRESDFAGSWYPGTEADCKREIEAFLKDNIPCPSAEKGGIGGIVPHAGWYFSGRIACNVIQCLKNHRTPDTIVIFGRHLHPSSKSYIMGKGLWVTPLGDLEIDRELADHLISEFPFVVETPSYYEQDNTIEVQLPFIKYFFPNTRILPIGTPPALPSLKIGRRVAEISKSMGRKILILGSSDLTHYGYNYGHTPKGVGQEAVDWVKNENDKRVVDLMLAMDAEGVIEESLKNHNACCSGAVASAISAVKSLGAKESKKMIYATSYDIRPDTSFVGYVGIIFL